MFLDTDSILAFPVTCATLFDDSGKPLWFYWTSVHTRLSHATKKVAPPPPAWRCTGVGSLGCRAPGNWTRGARFEPPGHWSTNIGLNSERNDSDAWSPKDSFVGPAEGPGSPHLTPHHPTSPHLTSPHPTSPHITSPHLTPHHITPHHLISPHITSPHPTSPHITSHHLTSPHITPHHPTSPHITPHHPTSHHITSPHLTPHHPTSPHITPHHLTSPHITPHHPTSPHLTAPHINPPPPVESESQVERHAVVEFAA